MPLPDRILARLRRAPRGQVFTPADFSDLGSTHAVGMALGRLARAGQIRRAARGLYDLPVRDPALGDLAAPSDAIVKALAARHRLRVQPTGALAAHLLGLTEQVPLKIAYLTDGTARRIRIGRREIVLRHSTPRNLAAAGRTSGLVIQALRWLGKENVSEQTAARLRQRLTKADRRKLAIDAGLAPAWVGAWMHKIAEDEAP